MWWGQFFLPSPFFCPKTCPPLSREKASCFAKKVLTIQATRKDELSERTSVSPVQRSFV